MNIDKKTGGFSGLGEFLVSVGKHMTGMASDSRVEKLITKTMTESIDSAGGVLVPDQFSSEVFNAALETSIVRPRANVLGMSTDSLTVANLVDSDRSSNIFGGIELKWIEEAEDKSSYESQPKLGQIRLKAHEGIAATPVSDALMADANNFASFFKFAFGRAIGWYEDLYYLQGLGAGQPLGVFNAPILIAPNRTAAGKVDGPDIGKLARRFLPGSWQNAVWLINQTVLGDWVDMQASAANTMSVINLADMKCLGRPIIVTEKCSALGTQGDILLADFSHYVIGNRSLIISASSHVPDYWQKNLTYWKLVIRVDGQPSLSSAITPYKGAATMSPFVTLATSS